MAQALTWETLQINEYIWVKLWLYIQIYYEIGLVVQEEKIFKFREFFKFFNVFSQFCNNVPLVYGRAFHMNKLESPSSKDDLCKVWLTLAQWFRRIIFFKLSMHFCKFVIISPGKKDGPYIWTNFSPLHPR